MLRHETYICPKARVARVSVQCTKLPLNSTNLSVELVLSGDCYPGVLFRGAQGGGAPLLKLLFISGGSAPLKYLH